MANLLIDMRGERYGRLTVVSLSSQKTNQGKPLWICKCDCGNLTTVPRKRLIDGSTKSCGCLRRELSTTSHTTHGMSRSGTNHQRLYRIWSGIKDRCTNPKSKYWKRYGGNGIGICESWKDDFTVFNEWAVNNGYSEKLTIDRIDNSKGYSPENCRWVDYKIQENNRTNNILYQIGGQIYTLAELSRIEGLSRHLTAKKHKEDLLNGK